MKKIIITKKNNLEEEISPGSMQRFAEYQKNYQMLRKFIWQ